MTMMYDIANELDSKNNLNLVTGNWNVICEKDFRQKVREVFDRVSTVLIKTLGPYGSTTIIEQYGDMCFTKDGWMVLKNIKFDDPISNNILMLLVRISAQVVIKVGDGSTSSIVAADSVLNTLDENKQFVSSIRPKEFMKLFNSCVSTIVDMIYENSHKVNKETYEDIYRLAHVSTNADDNIAEIITTIYKKTNNPSIEYHVSKTNETYYEIVDGYTGNITYLDSIFVNNNDGSCKIKNPLILLFDHKIDMERTLPLIGKAAMIASEKNTRLIVAAPNYDKFLLEYIRKNINIEYKTRGTSTVVYTRASLLNNLSFDLYNDFAVMCGAQVISEQFVEEIKDEEITEYLGIVDEMIIGDKTTFISGFSSRNDTMYEKIVNDAQVKYENMLEANKSKGIVDIKLNELKQRVTKLRGVMGIIYVGGNSELEKIANNYLVEDAVKACESAYEHGYNCGGNLIIPRMINEYLDVNENQLDDETKKMFSILNKSFIDVYKILLANKYDPDTEMDKIDEITCKLLSDEDNDLCYDLVNDSYSKDIINSCETDVEILKATASIVSLLMSSNQYISIMTQDN